MSHIHFSTFVLTLLVLYKWIPALPSFLEETTFLLSCLHLHLWHLGVNKANDNEYSNNIPVYMHSNEHGLPRRQSQRVFLTLDDVF